MRAKGYALFHVFVTSTCLLAHLLSPEIYECSSLGELVIENGTFIQAVPTSKGQALADEYGIKFFETVSKQLTVLEFISS